MHDEPDETRRLLELDHAQIRTRIDLLDDARFKIKNWAVSSTGVLLALGFQSGQRAVVLLGLPAALMFAGIESDYLARLRACRERHDEIERVMEAMRRDGYGPVAKAYVFGMRSVRSWSGFRRRLALLFDSHSRAGSLYAMLVVVVLISAVLI